MYFLRKRKIFVLYIFSFLFLFFYIFLTNPSPVLANYSSEIEQIQQDIEEQQKKIKELGEQQKVYEEKIDIKRKEAINLKSQLSILSSQISKTGIEIKTKETEINATNLIIKNLQYKIIEQQEEINQKKEELKRILQLVNKEDQKSILEAIFLNDSITDILGNIRYLSSLNASLSHSLTRIKLVKEGLELQEKDVRLRLQDLGNLKNEIEDKKKVLANEKYANQYLLKETRGAEWKFQSLLAEAKQEQQKMENDIARMETEVRNRLAQEKDQSGLLEEEGNIVFSWPVPFEKVTCVFHDPDYPYRNWIGEHSGVDLRAGQGTLLRAAASGYVARARNGGMGYSYIMLIHNDTFSTVYGHVSEFWVEGDEYVRRGQVIGKSGGLPGTPGAGRFSTGPHLHFEVRRNGVPVNPLDYLL